MTLLERIQKELNEPRSFDSFLKLKQHEAQSLLDLIGALEEYQNYIFIHAASLYTGRPLFEEFINSGEQLAKKITSIKSKMNT